MLYSRSLSHCDILSLSLQTIPASAVSVLHELMMNGVLAVACPQLQQTLQPHFDKLDTADSAVRWGEVVRLQYVLYLYAVESNNMLYPYC